jgi:DNA-binding NarL/FixJ family response regulator
LREIMTESLGYKAVCELRRASDLHHVIFASDPGLVVVTSGLLREDPSGTLRGLRAKLGPDVRIALLGAVTNVTNAERSLVDAVIDDRLERHEIIEGLRTMLRGQRVVRALDLRHTAVAEWERLAPRLGRLAPRARQVFDLLVSGSSNKEISRLLGISEATVKCHVSTVLAVFGLKRRVHIVAIVARMRALGVV